jgi:CHAT domain-containing protein
VTVLAYTPLSDRLLVWHLSAAGARMTSVPLSAGRLGAMVERFASLTAGDADSAAARALGRALFDLLVQPARPALPPDGELVVVTEGALDRLPFAALRDARGRYLIERVAIRHASSLDAARGAGGSPDAPLARAPVVVGDPSFDRALFPELELLRGASREVADVAAAHPASEIVQPAGATRSAVTQALARASLFHFAGHARIVAGAAHLSHLVLARAPGGFEANVLYAADIARLDLRRVRLVVLSSCGTTQALARRGDAARGLSEAFLAAGAGAVVSSLWEADDEGTAALMADFHRAAAGGASGPEALRQAQIGMLRGPPEHRAPRTWAAFRYEGR